MEALVTPMAVSLVLLGAYNYLRWHSVLKFSYNGEGFNTPIGRGIEGLLFSPGKSMFLFNPLAVLGLVGLGVLLVCNRAVGVLFMLLIIPRLIFFAKWESWQGGLDWGPRFLMPVVLLFVIAAVEVLHRTSLHSALGFAARVMFIVLCLAGVGVNYLSVRVPYEQWYRTLESPSLRAPFERVSPLIADPDQPNAVGNAYDFTYRASQISGDVDLLQAGRAQLAPAEFGGDRNAVGWMLVGLGALLLIGAGSAAVGADGVRTRRRAGDEDGVPEVGPAPERVPVEAVA